jgi:hypothetical protein
LSSAQGCRVVDNRLPISYYHSGKRLGRLLKRLRCLRHFEGAAKGVSPSAWLFVAAVLGLLWLGPGTAMALGPQPVKPPVSPRPGLKPEPAPVAATPTPQRSTTGAPSSSNPPPPAATTTQAASHQGTPVRSSVTRTKPKSETQRTPAKPSSSKPDATRSGPSERATNRVALSAPRPGSSGSDRLLFYGGLALLLLVLGDAAFLTLASRVLRDPAER